MLFLALDQSIITGRHKKVTVFQEIFGGIASVLWNMKKWGCATKKSVTQQQPYFSSALTTVIMNESVWKENGHSLQVILHSVVYCPPRG